MKFFDGLESVAKRIVQHILGVENLTSNLSLLTDFVSRAFYIVCFCTLCFDFLFLVFYPNFQASCEVIKNSIFISRYIIGASLLLVNALLVFDALAYFKFLRIVGSPQSTVISNWVISSFPEDFRGQLIECRSIWMDGKPNTITVALWIDFLTLREIWNALVQERFTELWRSQSQPLRRPRL